MADKNTSPNALQSLKAQLKAKKPGRLYFFYGEEQFLLHYYLDAVKKLLVDELTESFNFHKLTQESFDLQGFADAVENLPMMAQATFVWVDEIDIFKLSENDRSQMAEILSDIPDYCTVIFTYSTVEFKPDKRLKKLWDAVQKAGTLVSFDKQEARDLIAWITRHFAAEGHTIRPELCNYLIELTGGTMTALAGEISKICAYCSVQEIAKSDIDAVTEPVLDAVVFQMTDLLGKGLYGSALQKLQQLFRMQQEPITILGAVGMHFRRLGTARTLLDNGKNAGELMAMTGLRDYPARKTIDTARHFSAEFCRKAAELVMETDWALKTSYDDPQRLLEVLLLQLAQEAKNG